MNTPMQATDPVAEPKLTSRAVVVLTGCSYLCVGLAFSYLDRRFGFFPVEALLWLVWALAGFGAGAFYLGRPGNAGSRHWKVQGTLGFVLALFPGFFMFSMLRWVGLTLMIIQGARAANLGRRRDFHLSLTLIFVVSLMVATHGNADWTLWFYLGPAWLLAGLALAWDHASSAEIPRWAKAGMTVSFIFLSLLLASVIFLFAPRPAMLGFGFLPPGTDTPGLFKQDAGNSHGMDGKAGGLPGTNGSSASGAATEHGTDQVQLWRQMLQDMRRAASDPHIPFWQRSLMGRPLDWADALLAALTGERVQVESLGEWKIEQRALFRFSLTWRDLLALLALLATCLWLRYWVWRRRYRLGMTLALACGWALASWQPMWSIRSSALALKWCLQQHGHPRTAGQSMREHLASAPALPALSRRWLDYATDLYCASRFGAVAATPMRARHMRQAIHGASAVLNGVVPELQRSQA